MRRILKQYTYLLSVSSEEGGTFLVYYFDVEDDKSFIKKLVSLETPNIEEVVYSVNKLLGTAVINSKTGHKEINDLSKFKTYDEKKQVIEKFIEEGK